MCKEQEKVKRIIIKYKESQERERERERERILDELSIHK